MKGEETGAIRRPQGEIVEAVSLLPLGDTVDQYLRGAIWKMEALISSKFVFPSFTAVNIRSLASAAPMTSEP